MRSIGQFGFLLGVLSALSCGDGDGVAHGAADGATADATLDGHIARDAGNDGRVLHDAGDAMVSDGSAEDAMVSDGSAGDAALFPSCPTFANRTMVGTRPLAANNESSGLMMSRKNDNVLWTHDDSGDSSRVFALTPEGKNLGIHTIDGAQFRDWEDMGLLQADGQWFFVMGDIGGNQGRAQVQVYLVPEPEIDASAAAANGQLTATVRLNLDYPDGEHNAEGLFVDPIDDSIYVVTKNAPGYTQIFRKSAPHVGGTSTLVEVAAVDFGKAPLRTGDTQASRVATAADISASGDEIVIKTYQSTFLWRRLPGTSVADAMATEPCSVPNSGGETIAFSASADAYFTTTEPASAPIYRFDRQ